MKFSIIIPVLNEAENINNAINNIKSIAGNNTYEIIVVDGDSAKSTIKAITDESVIKIVSDKGRGRQMNKGVTVSSEEILVFLHADTKLPDRALDLIEAQLGKEECRAGAFKLNIDSESIPLKAISFFANLRTFFTRVPYGDQAIFIRKECFIKLGGYRDIPIMEDLDLMKRIKGFGGKIKIINDPVKTSPRRWEKEGIFYTIARNLLVRMLYSFGVSPEKLAGMYASN